MEFCERWKPGDKIQEIYIGGSCLWKDGWAMFTRDGQRRERPLRNRKEGAQNLVHILRHDEVDTISLDDRYMMNSTLCQTHDCKWISDFPNAHRGPHIFYARNYRVVDVLKNLRSIIQFDID